MSLHQELSNGAIISNFKQHIHNEESQAENISSVALRIRSAFVRRNTKMDNLTVSNFTQPSRRSFDFAGVERR